MRIATLSAVFVMLAPLSCPALTIDLTYSLTTDKSTYTVGEPVLWELSVLSQDDLATPQSIAGLDVSLLESTPELLAPATIGTDFLSYDIQDGGLALGNQVSNISIVEIFLPSGDVKAGGVLASGSYTTTVLGLHTLQTDFGNPADSAYVNPSTGNTVLPYDAINNDAVTFTVIPEPSAMILLTMGVSILLVVFGYRKCRSGWPSRCHGDRL